MKKTSRPTYKLTHELQTKLVGAAASARRRAYAPYSRFHVGAALLSAQGKIFTGGNIENASYGLTICAERVALAKAISEGARKFHAIAVVGPHARLSPCGACRQMLAEFGGCIVLCADSRRPRRIRTHQLSELLPQSFRL